MIVVWEAVRSVDVGIYHVLNAFAGNRWLDYLANVEENDNLLKGGLFLAMYWYLWFRTGPDQNRRRTAILVTFAAVLVALFACRVVADIAPFRVRPMYDSGVQHQPYSFPVSPKLVNWSSCPSDNATLFFGLAFGIAYLWRRLAVPALLYAAVWICLPRMFLGVHYASDVVAGAAIGIALVWISLKMEWLQNKLGRPVLYLENAKPEIFYAAAFLASFEMGILFDDVRGAASALAHVFKVSSDREFIHVGLQVLAITCLAVLIAAGALVGNRRFHGKPVNH